MKNCFISILTIFYCCSLIKAQVGIGTASPNHNAILEIYSIDKGVQMPGISSKNSLNLGSTEESMWIMDTTSKKPYYWNGTEWKELSALRFQNAEYTLDCRSIVNNSYLEKGKSSAAYISMNINVETPGVVNLVSNTVNSVRYVGAFILNQGRNTITLESIGYPNASGNVNFVFTNGATSCSIPTEIY